MTAEPARPRLTIIVAMAKNGVIGKANALPWHIPEDLRRFKALTMGHPLIMGRKTFDSIGRVLPGRRNIVVSRNPRLSIPGAEVAVSLENAIAGCSGEEDVFVIGGQQIYERALPLANRIELTEVDCEIDGDAFFPSVDPAAWKQSSGAFRTDPESGLRYRFTTLDRRD